MTVCKFSSFFNIKIGSMQHFTHLDYFARAMACVLYHFYWLFLISAFKESFLVLQTEQKPRKLTDKLFLFFFKGVKFN